MSDIINRPKPEPVKLGKWDRIVAWIIFGFASIDMLTGICLSIIAHCCAPLFHWTVSAFVMLAFGMLHVRLGWEVRSHRRTYIKLRMLSDLFNGCRYSRDTIPELSEYTPKAFADNLGDWMKDKQCIIGPSDEIEKLLKTGDTNLSWHIRIDGHIKADGHIEANQ